MKKIYFLLLFACGYSFGQGFIDFDDASKWNAEGTISLITYANHEYIDGVFSAELTNALRNGTADQDGFPGAFGVYSVRLRNDSNTSLTMFVASGGIGEFSFKARRWDGSPATNFAVEISIDNGTTWTLSSNIDGSLTTDSDWKIITGTINSSNNNVGVRIRSLGTTERLMVDDFSWTAPGNDPSLVITSPSNNTIFNPLVAEVNIGFNVTNFIVGDNPGDDGFIKYSVNGGTTTNKFDTDPINLTGLTPGDYTVQLELVDTSGNSLSPAVTAGVSFSIANLNTVANIAAVKADVAAEGQGKYYELSSEAIITYTRSNRNQKYIQDGTGGLLIDDPDAVITSALNENDGILNFKFQTSVFNGVLQARPLENISANSNGNTVTPTVLSISDYVTNYIQYESTLIQFNNVTISEGDGSTVFATNTNYTVTDGTDTVVFRTIFAEADYIGENIPSVSDNRIFMAVRFNTSPQVVAKNLQDLSLSTEQFTATNFSLYPNPATNGSVTISSNSADAMQVQVYDVLGKVVKNETVSNNTLDVSNLNTGLYIVKITQNQSSVTKKLMIR